MSQTKNSVKQAIATGHTQSHKGFLAHLFGLDEPSKVAHQRLAQTHKTPAQVKTVSKMSALQALKHLNPFDGLVLTLNKLMLILIVFLAGWLFVIYFIRHNDSVPKQQLYNRMAHSGVYRDLEILNGSRLAIPVRTGSNIGDVYDPQTAAMEPTAPTRSNAIVSTSGAANALGTSDNSNAVQPSAPQAELAHPGIYDVPISTPSGMKLRTFVNR